MVMLLHDNMTPRELLGQPLLPNETCVAYGRRDEAPVAGRFTVVAVTDTVTVPAGAFGEVLDIRTDISSTSDYPAGQRDTWLAPDVGLIEMAQQKDDGSTTTADLWGRTYMRRI